MDRQLALARVQLQKEKEARKATREERLWQLLTDPTVKRFLLLAAIVAYTAYVNSHREESGPVSNSLAVALPSVGIPMLAAEAGVTDWKVLAGLALASGGIAAVTNQDVVDAVSLELPGDGPPVVSLFGPLAGLQWSVRKWKELT